MFTDQQKEVIRQVFGAMYEVQINTNVDVKFTAEMVKKALFQENIGINKVRGIMKAMVLCGYLTVIPNNKDNHYILAEGGKRRYKAYLELQEQNTEVSCKEECDTKTTTCRICQDAVDSELIAGNNGECIDCLVEEEHDRMANRGY